MSERLRVIPISPKAARLLVPRERLDALMKDAGSDVLVYPLGKSGVSLCVCRQRAKIRHEIKGDPDPVNKLVAALSNKANKAEVDRLLKRWMN